MKRSYKGFINTVSSIEMILAIFILVSVAANAIHLITLFGELINISSFEVSYELFEGLLAHVLLLVIGLELAMMLVNHTTSAVIEVMLYAVARKMLIYTHSTYEMLAGVVALAGIFVIRKYLYCSEIGKVKDCVMDGKEPVKSLNNLIGSNIPEEFGKNVADMIKCLSPDKKINKGDIFQVSNVELEVLEEEEGYPEKIKITELEDN